jgi:asparagine synthase (glutamine-hydrolysing)
MCGIAGFAGGRTPYGDPERALIIERMCRVITHRGPDDQGIMLKDGVALGMRRLSIIDLAGGRQPLSGEDGLVTVVFNGEVYNYRDLQHDLEARGHSFQTQSDTEAIVHAYEEYGDRCVEHFRGMFAFALWDARSRVLFGARDRVGKKPFYYTVTPEQTLVFGSELKCLLAHPQVRREISHEALDAYLTLGYVPDPLSIFKAVYKLPPGHSLAFHYEPVDPRPEAEYLEELRAQLDDAVRVRLVADVPVGAFLSGGIDSSTVVGLMARHMQQPVKTFSIGFQGMNCDELRHARLAAAHFHTDHHEFVVTPEIWQSVDELVWYLDEPFVDSSAVPTYVVSKLARNYVKVVLTGDGGDELFAGYRRYVTHRRRRGFACLPRSLRHGALQPLARRLPHSVWGRNYLYNVALDPLDQYIDSLSIVTSLNRRSLYSEDFHRNVEAGGVSARLREYASRARTGVSLEARAPLLDHHLIEFVTRIPGSMKMHGLEPKHILRRAVQSLVPDEIIGRPKRGFGIRNWIDAALHSHIRSVLLDRGSLQRGYFDPHYVRVLLNEHLSGRRNHSATLWALFMLELWHRVFVDQGRDLVTSRPSGGVLQSVTV